MALRAALLLPLRGDCGGLMPIELHRDGPWNLPEGWVWARLGQLGRWTGGGTPSKANAAFWANGTVPWVSPKDMKVDVIGDTEDFITPDAVVNSATKLVAENSILMVVRSGILKHTFPVALSDREVTINQDMRALTPLEGVEARYLAFVLRRLQRHVLDECSKDGTTVASVEPALLEKVWVPIPPTAEQRRIVARIDELFTEINDGEATLARARADLDTWRRALLKAAVTGELTREWRKRNKLTREKGAFDQLLKRRNLREKDADPRNHAEVGATRRSLSDGWIKGVLEQVGRIESGQTPTGIATMTNQGGTIPWFKVSSMNDANANGWMTNSEWWISEKAANEMKLRIHPVGTIVFPKRGGSILTNKKRRLAVRGCIDLNTMGFVPLEAYREYSWVVFQQIDLRRIYDGSNVPQINYGDVAEITLAIPPPKEGEEIARRAMDALSVVDDVAAELEAGSAAAVALRRSTLKAAFEGRLVEQDPSDEPAECLLARLNIPASGSRARLARGTVGANA